MTFVIYLLRVNNDQRYNRKFQVLGLELSMYEEIIAKPQVLGLTMLKGYNCQLKGDNPLLGLRLTMFEEIIANFKS